MSCLVVSKFDMNEIAPRLWQGGVPSAHDLGEPFDVIVLCAKELQYPSERYPGATVVHAPLTDIWPMVPGDQTTAIQAAGYVHHALAARKKCLITCHMGLNRSGLVTGLTLVLGGKTSDQAIAQIRARRKGALYNKSFIYFLHQISRMQMRPNRARALARRAWLVARLARRRERHARLLAERVGGVVQMVSDLDRLAHAAIRRGDEAYPAARVEFLAGLVERPCLVGHDGVGHFEHVVVVIQLRVVDDGPLRSVQLTEHGDKLSEASDRVDRLVGVHLVGQHHGDVSSGSQGCWDHLDVWLGDGVLERLWQNELGHAS